jgi:hypothetical protein
MSVEDPTVVLVIASAREQQFGLWVDAWWDEERRRFPWDKTILVQDGDGPARFRPDDTDGDDVYERWDGIIHYTWGDIGKGYPGRLLPDWLSRNDSGIKAWGFLRAVIDHGADVVITLDDDCLPSELGADPSRYRANPPAGPAALTRHARAAVVAQHLDALSRTRRWTTTVPGFVPRGLPYGRPDPRLPDNSLGRLPVALNMGLWATVPDRDAVHELTNRDSQGGYRAWKPRKDWYRHTRVMSAQQYWPMCGMNLAFRRDIAPLMYFPRMGAGVPFRRFDDIWCGIIAQKCLHHLGLAAAVGKPIVSHSKASDPMNNLVGEAPGIRANEEFWQAIHRLSLNGCGTPIECMVQLAEQLRDFEPKVGDPNLKSYLPQLGKWMIEWVLEFHKAGWEGAYP